MIKENKWTLDFPDALQCQVVEQLGHDFFKSGQCFEL